MSFPDMRPGEIKVRERPYRERVFDLLELYLKKFEKLNSDERKIFAEHLGDLIPPKIEFKIPEFKEFWNDEIKMAVWPDTEPQKD